MDEEEAEAWARSELCRAGLVAVAKLLEPEGVHLVAFKGIHLAFGIAEHPRFRPMTDADAVIVRGSYDRALRLLARDHDVQVNDWSAAAVVDAERNVAIDLHRSPLPPFFGRFDLRALAARSQALAGMPDNVRVPDPVDATALALAHHVKDKFRHTTLRDLRMLRDRAGVTGSDLAARAESHGLRRISLLALTDLSRVDGSFSTWVDAFAPTSAERRWARFVADSLSERSSRARAFLLSRAVGDDLGSAARGLLLGAMTRAPFLLREWMRSGSVFR